MNCAGINLFRVQLVYCTIMVTLMSLRVKMFQGKKYDTKQNLNTFKMAKQKK